MIILIGVASSPHLLPCERVAGVLVQHVLEQVESVGN